MYLKLRHIMHTTLYHSNAYLLLSRIASWKLYNPVKILLAHDIIDPTDDLYAIKRSMGELERDDFKKRVEYLLGHYKFVALEKALEMLKVGPEQRSRNNIVLTFDDGYRSIYTRAYPILKKYGIPATVFLTTNFIRNTRQVCAAKWSDLMWYDQLMYAVAHTPLNRISFSNAKECSYAVSTLVQKTNFVEHVCNYLKEQRETEKHEILASLLDRLGFPNEEQHHVRPYRHNPLEMLSWDEIQEMSRSGLMSFGAHTRSHPILTRIPLADARCEIVGSKKDIEEKLGTEVIAFAYPNGGCNDFNQEIIEIMNEAGFRCACTTIPKSNNHKDNLMLLGRDSFDNDLWCDFALRAAGFQELISPRWKFAKRCKGK